MGQLQSEKGEWTMLPDGQLVQVAATKKHSQMKDDEVTDDLPDGSYIFSNAKYMKINKKDFVDVIVDAKSAEYKEGETPTAYKEFSFADKYFSGPNKQTPAEMVKRIQRVHKVINDEEQKYNPFIQKANQLNKENRQEAINIIMEVSESIKPPEDDGVEVYAESNANPAKFNYGGFVGRKGIKTKYNRDYQSGGDVFSGAASGASAGATLGSVVPLFGTAVGAGVGALVGGVGSWLTGRGKKKEEKKRIAEMQAAMQGQRDSLEKQRGMSHLGTAAQIAMPTTKDDVADYTDIVQRSDNAYGRAIGDYTNLRDNADALATKRAMSLNRAVSNSGMSPQQRMLLANQSTSNAVDSATNQKFNLSGQVANLRLKQDQATQGYRSRMIDDQVASDNKYNTDIENKFRTGIDSGINTELANEQGQSDVNYREYAQKYGIQNAMATENANAQARFQNSMGRFASAYANAKKPQGNGPDSISSDSFYRNNDSFKSLGEGQYLDSRTGTTYKNVSGQLIKVR